jgi:hypothetical protein
MKSACTWRESMAALGRAVEEQRQAVQWVRREAEARQLSGIVATIVETV